MGQIRKINDVYYIEFYARGLLYSQVAGGDVQEAQRLLDQVEAKIATGEALTIARHIELVDFYERFLKEASIQHAPKSVARFTSTIKDFSNFIDANFPLIHQLAELTPVVVESYKMYLVRARKPQIVNLSILLLRDILEFGIKLGFLNDNPSLHISLLPWPQRPLRSETARYKTVRQLVSQGVGAAKIAQLLKLPDISRVIYFSALIPLSRQDEYR